MRHFNQDFGPTHPTTRKKIKRIVGDITPESLDTLKEETRSVLVTIKSHHFKVGQEYGHLEIIAPEQEYHGVIGDNTWTYKPSADMLEYNLDVVDLNDAEHSQA